MRRDVLILGGGVVIVDPPGVPPGFLTGAAATAGMMARVILKPPRAMHPPSIPVPVIPPVYRESHSCQ